MPNEKQQGALQRQEQQVVLFGKLVPGVAHDLNNALGAIIGYTDLLLESVTEAHIRRRLATIKKAAGKAAMLTQQLMKLNQQLPLDPSVAAHQPEEGPISLQNR